MKTDKQRGLTLSSPTEQLNKECSLRQKASLALLIWLLSASCGGILISACRLSLFGIVPLTVITLTVAVIMIFRNRPNWLLAGAAVYVIGFCLFIFLPGIFHDGFCIVVNAILKAVGGDYRLIFTPLAFSGAYVEKTAVTCFCALFAPLLTFFLGWMLLHKNRIYLWVSSALVLIVVLCFLLPPAPFFAVAYLTAMCGAAVYLTVRDDTASVASCLLGITAGVLIVLCLLPGGTGKTAIQQGVENRVVAAVDSARYGNAQKKAMPLGDLAKPRPLNRSENEALEITTDYGSSLYLRGFCGAEYQNQKWQEPSDREIEEYSDLFYWLHQNGFYGYGQYATASALCGEKNTTAITVKNTGAYRKYQYAPTEYVATANGKNRLGADLPFAADSKVKKEYTYEITTNPVKNATETVSALANENGAEKENYLQNEAAYRDYVYSVFLSLPKEVKAYLKVKTELSPGKKAHPGYEAVMQEIFNDLLLNVTYNEEAEIAGDDFLLTFLDGNAEGYSIHYATAAAMLFRYYGIPARYIEGYVVTPRDAYHCARGETVTLTEKNGHAWVEYYRDGIGWIPFEVTPQYLYIMEIPDQIKSQISDLYDSDSLGTGAEEIKDDNYEDNRETDAPEDETAMPLWQVLCFIGGGIVLLLLFTAAFLVIRYRLAMKKRFRFWTELSPNDAVDAVFCDILRILRYNGLADNNTSLEDYREIMAVIFPALAEEWLEMVALHRLAIFSKQTMTAANKQRFFDYRTKVIQTVSQRRRFYQRLADRYLNHLY